MKTSKKWTIHIACYVIAALALSVLNELHPAVKYRTEVIEPQTEAMQPTAVIDLDNATPMPTPDRRATASCISMPTDSWRS